MTHIFKLTVSGMLGFLAACGPGETKTEVPAASAVLNEKTFVLDKLLGTWGNNDGKNFERWTKGSDGRYYSFVYSLNGTDTVVGEQAVVYKEDTNWVFENRVSGQNDGKLVKFVSAFVEDNAIEFRNPTHDFPNVIHYSLPNNAQVHAFIVGNNDKGGKDTIPFNYRRAR